MTALHAIQHDFQDYLLQERQQDAPAIVAAVRAQYGLGAADRLAIYHRAYRSRLREALCEAYDKTWSYIGDEMFAELADSYVASHPSPHRNLRWYGDGLAAHAAQLFPDYPFIAELARLEWTLGLAFDAADDAPLQRTDLAAVAPEAWAELVFALHPSVHLLANEWNAVALWQAMAAGEEAPEPARSEAATHWLVWRQSGQPHFRSLPALEAQALRHIAAGLSFGAVCDAAGASGGEAAALAGYLQHWFAQQILVFR